MSIVCKNLSIYLSPYHYKYKCRKTYEIIFKTLFFV